MLNTPHTLIPDQALQSLLYYASRSPAGAFAEVGVYQGGSAWHLAKFLRPLYLYDTFEGMPVSGPYDTHQIGDFNDCSASAVQSLIPQAIVVKGRFPESLIDMPPLAFVHADVDQYESTKAILEHMPSRMVRGGMILFDDYLVDDCPGCTQAVNESPYRILVVGETGKAIIIV